MFKKIALAAALAATASFATWDYFPVQEAGKGQVEIADITNMQGKATWLETSIRARYTIVQNFEAGIQIPFQTYAWDDGKAKDDAFGLEQIELMLRYQFLPNVNAFLDVKFHTCGDKVYCYDDAFQFHFGAQFSQNFGIVDFGSELGLKLETEGKNKGTSPLDMNIGLEADFVVNDVIIPYVGIGFNILLGKDDDTKISRTGETGIFPYAGLVANITKMFYLGADLTLGFGEKYNSSDKTLIIMTVKAGLNF